MKTKREIVQTPVRFAEADYQKVLDALELYRERNHIDLSINKWIVAACLEKAERDATSP